MSLPIFIELQDVFTQETHVVNTAHITRISPYPRQNTCEPFQELNHITGALVFLDDGSCITIFDREAYVAAYDVESLNFGMNVTAARNLGQYISLAILKVHYSLT